jgi:hypothetical protein
MAYARVARKRTTAYGAALEQRIKHRLHAVCRGKQNRESPCHGKSKSDRPETLGDCLQGKTARALRRAVEHFELKRKMPWEL